jgi:hypothetical protein
MMVIADALAESKPPAVPSSKKGKGRAKVEHSRLADEVDSNTKSEQFDAEREPEIKPKPRGSPCKDVLKDAAKRMKKM